MMNLSKSRYIVFILLSLVMVFQPFMGIALANALGDLPEMYFEVLKIESPEYDSKALKTIYDFYKIDEDMDITEQFEKVTEGMKDKPPGVIVLQPAMLDTIRRGVAEFQELEPIALERGKVTTLNLKYNDETAVASRHFTVELEIYLDETLESGIGFNAVTSITGYDIVQEGYEQVKRSIERGPLPTSGEAEVQGHLVRIRVFVPEEMTQDERVGAYDNRYQFKIIGVQAGPSTTVVNTEADSEAGESGTSVAPIIIVGALGLAGAALGIKAMGNKNKKSKKSEDKKEEQSSYKMYVSKDFGDKLKKGGAHEFVYARMVEVKKDGVEVKRDDLTARIEIFSPDTYMQVGNPTISGDYMGASVKADYFETGGPEEGTVSFKFTGEGGVFQNNVKFKLVGDPYIYFPEKGEDLFPSINMVYGCNGKYSYEVEFRDFTKPLTNAQIEIPRDDLADGKLEKLDEYRYVIRLNNLSAKNESTSYKTESFNIKVTGENESEFVEDRVRVVLQPEGLSVVDMDKEFDEDGNFKVICYPDADNKESNEVLPTRFKLQLIIAEKNDDGEMDVKVVPPSEYTPEFGELMGTDQRTNTLVSRYPIEVNAAGVENRGVYRFEPKQSLPEPEVGRLIVKQPISAEYGNEKYELELKVRLIGEPMDPMAGWDEELEILRKRVERYGLSADLAERMRALGRNRSTQELRLLNKMILVESSIYFTNEAREYNDIADRLQQIETGLEVIKWLGDQSFSVLMTIYTGPAGEAIITPAKEILVAMIGEVGTQIFMGETFVFENLKVADNISAVFESYILNSLGPDMSMKKAGVVIAGFAIFNFSKHYLLDVDQSGNRDFYRALNSAFSDLTSTTMKIAAGKYFENLVGSKKNGEKLQGWVSNWLKDGLPDMVYDEAGEKILSKYLEEICGKGAAWVYGTLNEASERGEINIDMDKLILTVPLEFENTGVKVPVYVGVDLTRITDSLFDYVYDRMFGPLPLPKEKANIPQDPTYTPNA